MTREEIIFKLHNEFNSLSDSNIHKLTKFIYKIFDDFENRSCDGCKHYVAINKSDTMVCALNMDCIRRYKLRDRWESKQC